MLWDRGRTLAYADDDDLVLDETRRCRRDPEVGRDRRLVRLGGRPAAPAAVGRDGHLRAAREGLHAADARGARGPARHLRRARVRGRDRPSRRPRRDRRRAAAHPPHRRRALPPGARADELLGLLDDRLPRPARRLRRDRHPRRAGARVQGPRQGAAPGRDRGDPRRGLQPHRRGQPPRPDAVVQGRRQLRLLPDDARRSPLLQGLHGHRQLAQPGEPVGAAADHGLAAVLRPRVPRRRVPVRPRLGARARVPRRRPALGLLRHHPPGSGALPGEADRRAVGRRRGRLPGRQLPRPLDRVERDVPRHDARLLARPEPPSPPSRSGSRARATSTSRTAGARSRRSTTSPATTASRCATSSPTTSATTRRTSRTTRTAPPTTARGTPASRARRTTRRSTSSATGRSATSSPR